MAEDFIAFETWLRPAASLHESAAQPPAPPVEPAAVPREPLRESALRDVRLFRARVAEALDARVDALLRDIAAAVLGRELQLAPVELAAVIARVRRARPHAGVTEIFVAPADAGTQIAEAAVRVDPALEPGDAVVRFTDGVVDARLGVRLADALEAWR